MKRIHQDWKRFYENDAIIDILRVKKCKHFLHTFCNTPNTKKYGKYSIFTVFTAYKNNAEDGT